ncbi:MAG: AAA family ATPase [Bacteroidales bacterium]|nr:AAA family ATPase [Bacteroidales bacterium]
MTRNPQIELAEKYVAETGVSIFLTGKAGTGKTTFLHHIVESCPKRHVVVAPTGVAAVNAGGVTIHSFFQLPFCPYLPEVKELVTEYQLPEHQRQLRKSKIDIIRTLELLIIDEISMVRADLLDAIDDTLRRYRRSNRPFGGVQLLMIGDVQQLAPVVTDDERPYMERVYPSPFFFHSKALQRLSYITIQLTTIYRQQDPLFVGLLNNIRDNNFDEATLAALNARVASPNQSVGKSSAQAQDPILLTTHNYQADRVNKHKLDALTTEAFVLDAVVEGNFPESSAPTEVSLTLKPGAQVMFVKNDGSGGHRYYNGKIGTVEALAESDEGTVVQVIDEEGDTIAVGRERWENIKYEIDPKDNQIKQIVDGTFDQYPLKAAWAITIHKAQGLTFDKVQVDAAAAFAYGQVYVALSRCRSLEGLTLLSPISARNSFDSKDIDSFNNTLTPPAEAEERLDEFRTQYYYNTLFELFGFAALQRDVERVERLFADNLRTTYPMHVRTLAEVCQQNLPSMVDVAERFHRQLMSISMQDNAKAVLPERISKATDYFLAQIKAVDAKVRQLLEVPVDNKEVKSRLKELGEAYAATYGLKEALLTKVRKEGFSLQQYQQTKVDFALQKPKKSKAAAAEAFAGVKYPQLAMRLSQWRRAYAEEMGLPVYVILQQKTLLAIADNPPQSSAQLAKVPGIGKTKLKQFGGNILQIVNDFRADNPALFPQQDSLNAFEEQSTAEEDEPKPKEPAWMRAAALFAEGKSIDEVAEIMMRAKGTVEGYLLAAVENGAMDADLVVSQEAQDEIIAYFLEHNALTTLKSVYEHFEGKYSYLQLRVARYVGEDLMQ